MHGHGVRVQIMIAGDLEVEPGHAGEKRFEHRGHIEKRDPCRGRKRRKFPFAVLPEEGQGMVESLGVEQVEAGSHPFVQVFGTEVLRCAADMGEHAGDQRGAGVRQGKTKGLDLLPHRLAEGVDRSKDVLDLVLFEKVDLQVPDEGRAEFAGLLIENAFHGIMPPLRHEGAKETIETTKDRHGKKD